MRDKTKIPVVVAEPDQPTLPAGDFLSWLEKTRLSLKSQGGSDVPCGGCTGCCRASQFIHIEPHESVALSRIPKDLLFSAPGLPEGHLLMGYDENGCCPMLVDDQCSIYQNRPLTCRNYDCRIFPAAGIFLDGPEKTPITERANRWRFEYNSDEAEQAQAAIQAAAGYLTRNAHDFAGQVPNNPIQLALLALKIYKVFLDEASSDEVLRDSSSSSGPSSSGPKIAKKIMAAYLEFNQRPG